MSLSKQCSAERFEMADRFYARFNLSHTDYLVFKEEFDKLQKERSDALKEDEE